MKYVSIDIETTGLNPDTCQVLELGAVIDDLVTPFCQLPTFRYRVKREQYTGEPYALSLHSKLFEDLAILDYNYDNPNDIIGHEKNLIVHFACWLGRNEIRPRDFVAAGKNFAKFDASFLQRLPKADKINWHHRVLDPGFMYTLPTDKIMPPTNICIARAGIDVSEIPGSPHSAIHDALVVCALAREGFAINKERLDA
jgi:hypothetical protein